MPLLRDVLLAVSLWCVATGALQKVLLMIRHGDRTTTYPSFPTEIQSEFSNGEGNITELGRMEGYDLGIRLRNMYQTFLTNNTDEVRANSSSYSGLVITTGCVLTGMYTPDDNETCLNGSATTDGWPVNVNFKPSSQDFVLGSAPCQKLKIQNQTTAAIEANNDYLQKYNETIEELANYTGYHNISDGFTVFKIYDNLLEEEIHNLTSQYTWVDPMWPAIEAAGSAAYFLPYTTNTSRKLVGGPLLNEIVQRIKDKKETTKLHLYGTGRTIMTPLLLLLGVDNDLPPPYVATVVVELHDNATVRLMYINSTEPPFSLQIPQCDMYCPVDQFVKLTSHFVVTDPFKECNVNTTESPKKNGSAKKNGSE